MLLTGKLPRSGVPNRTPTRVPAYRLSLWPPTQVLMALLRHHRHLLAVILQCAATRCPTLQGLLLDNHLYQIQDLPEVHPEAEAKAEAEAEAGVEITHLHLLHLHRLVALHATLPLPAADAVVLTAP